MMNINQSITCFDTQFQKQVAGSDFAFNPFGKVAPPFVRGRVLDQLQCRNILLVVMLK